MCIVDEFLPVIEFIFFRLEFVHQVVDLLLQIGGLFFDQLRLFVHVLFVEEIANVWNLNSSFKPIPTSITVLSFSKLKINICLYPDVVFDLLVKLHRAFFGLESILARFLGFSLRFQDSIGCGLGERLE